MESFEIIAISLAQQENFTALDIEEENIAVRIEQVSYDLVNHNVFMFMMMYSVI